MLILGDATVLEPYLRDLMPDAMFVVVASKPTQAAKGVETVSADPQHLPFKRWVFDLALVFDMLPRIGEPVHMLNGILRSLRPGGELAIGHLAGAGDVPTVPELARWLADFGARCEAAEREGNEVFVLCIAP